MLEVVLINFDLFDIIEKIRALNKLCYEMKCARILEEINQL